MNQQMRLLIAGFFLLNFSACSLPLKVEKVDSMKNQVNGVRYKLKRPTYSAGLRIDFNQTKFLMNPGFIEDEYTKVKNDLKNDFNLLYPDKQSLNDKSWTTASNITHPQKHYCLKVGENALMTVLQQKMDEDYIIYEATSRISPPHWFADSESSITMDDDGYLTAIMAGEDDKSLEFIQAIAGLAISALSPAGAKEESACLLIKDEKFHNYVTEHIQLATLKIKLTDNLNKTLKNLNPSPQLMQSQLESVNLLRAEIERVNESLKEVQYEMKEGTFVVDEVKDEKDPSKNVPLVKKLAGKTPWIKFELTSQDK